MIPDAFPESCESRYQEIPIVLKVPSQWKSLKQDWIALKKTRLLQIKVETARQQAAIEAWRTVAREKAEAQRLKLLKKPAPAPAKPARKLFFSWRKQPDLPMTAPVFPLNQSHADLLANSPFFNAGFYQRQLPLDFPEQSDPLSHYLSVGWLYPEYSPHPGFDGIAYLLANPDIRLAGLDPLVHWIKHGRAEGRPLQCHGATFLRHGAPTAPPLVAGWPAVTAIVTSYNHAPFLKERLLSILKQDHPVAEIIVLDDASSDASVEIAHEVLACSPVPARLLVRGENSGSAFGQWEDALHLAKTELVWLAESDDSCKSYFLKYLVPWFHDNSIVLAYAESARMDHEGAVYSMNYDDCTKYLDAQHWQHSGKHGGREEIERFLSVRNTIPNISGTVFRRDAALKALQEKHPYKIVGDWHFYVNLLRQGDLAYDRASLNYHRRHAENVMTREGNGRLIEEARAMQAWIRQNFPASEARRTEMEEFLLHLEGKEGMQQTGMVN